jgi:hypothetical protein
MAAVRPREEVIRRKSLSVGEEMSPMKLGSVRAFAVAIVLLGSASDCPLAGETENENA